MNVRLKNLRSWPMKVEWLEEAHFLITVNSPQALIRAVLRYRRRHGGDLRDGWQERLAATLCKDERYAELCEPIKADQRQLQTEEKVKHIGRAEISRFLQTVQKFIHNGGELVEQSLANERAQICTTCPENVPIKGCMGCSGLVPKLLKVTKGAGTEHDKQLRGCGVCGCQLKAKVHLPAEVINDDDDDLEFPEHCWMNN